MKSELDAMPLFLLDDLLSILHIEYVNGSYTYFCKPK